MLFVLVLYYIEILKFLYNSGVECNLITRRTIP